MRGDVCSRRPWWARLALDLIASHVSEVRHQAKDSQVALGELHGWRTLRSSVARQSGVTDLRLRKERIVQRTPNDERRLSAVPR